MKQLLFTYGDFNGLLSSAILRKYFSTQQKNPHIQTFFLSNDILTSGTKLFKKFIKKNYDNVFILRCSSIKYKIFWIVEQLFEKINFEKLYVYDDKNTQYDFRTISLENKNKINITIDSTTILPYTLSKIYNVKIPDIMQVFINREDKPSALNNALLLTRVFGNDGRVLSKIEKFLLSVLYDQNNLEKRFNGEFHDYMDIVFLVRNKLLEVVSNESYDVISNGVVHYDKTELGYDISDRFIGHFIWTRRRQYKIVLVTEKDRGYTYIYTALPLKLNPFILCKDLKLDCKGYYSALEPKEIYEKLFSYDSLKGVL